MYNWSIIWYVKTIVKYCYIISLNDTGTCISWIYDLKSSLQKRNISTLFISTLLYIADGATIKIEGGSIAAAIVNKTVTAGIKFLRFSAKVPISIVSRRIKFFTAHCARRKGELRQVARVRIDAFPRAGSDSILIQMVAGSFTAPSLRRGRTIRRSQRGSPALFSLMKFQRRYATLMTLVTRHVHKLSAT